MEASERVSPTAERRERVGTDQNQTEPRERGYETAEGTSVRARWRVSVLPGDGDSPPRTGGREAASIPLVQVRLENPDPVDQYVRVRNALDGPVLYPRRRGVPEAGWDRSGFAGAVSAGADRALGYACPAPIEAPPIELESIREDAVSAADGAVSPAAVVRRHGGAAPPAVAVRERVSEGARSASPDPESPAESERPEATARADRPSAQSDRRAGEPSVPDAVATWLEEIERRTARVERLEGAAVAEATTALTETGGLEPALEAAEQLQADADALRALATRASVLAERADAATVPEDALRGLA
jgi:hypothetical protein